MLVTSTRVVSEDSVNGDLSVRRNRDDASDESVVEKIKRSKDEEARKLPENFKNQLTDNSRDAADNALKNSLGVAGSFLSSVKIVETTRSFEHYLYAGSFQLRFAVKDARLHGSL